MSGSHRLENLIQAAHAAPAARVFLGIDLDCEALSRRHEPGGAFVREADPTNHSAKLRFPDVKGVVYEGPAEGDHHKTIP